VNAEETAQAALRHLRLGRPRPRGKWVSRYDKTEKVAETLIASGDHRGACVEIRKLLMDRANDGSTPVQIPPALALWIDEVCK